MRKKSFFFITLALIVCVYALSAPIFKSALEWYLKGYCQECLGGRLHFDSFYKENGAWIVEKPQLISFNSLQEGGHHLRAEKILIMPSISLWDRKLHFDIQTIFPDIDIGYAATALKQFLSSSSAELFFFQVSVNFSVSQGKMTLHEFQEEKNPDSLPIFFHVDLACHESTQACLSLKFAQEKENCLKVAVTEQNQKKQLGFLFDQIDGTKVSRAFKALWPEFNHWNISQGLINGVFNLEMNSENVSLGTADVIVKDLNFQNPLLKMKGVFPEVHFSLLNASTAHLEMPVTGSLIFTKDNSPNWQVEKAKVDVIFNQKDEAKITFEGICDYQEKKTSVHIEGDVKFSDDFQASMNFGMKLSKPGEEDVEAQFYTRQLGTLWNFIELNLTNFGAGEFAFFQNLFADSFPQWKQIRVYEGTLSATLLMYLQNYQLADFRMEKMAVHNLVADFDPWEISLQVKESLGGLSLDLSRRNLLETLNGNFYIKQGNLTFIGLDEEKWRFSDIHTNLAIESGVLQKSLIKGAFAGLKGGMEVDFHAPEKIVKLNFSGGPQDLANLLPEGIKAGIKKNFAHDQVEIVACANRKEGGLIVDGSMVLHGEGKNSQEITFGFDLEKTPLSLWEQWPPHAFSQAYWRNVGADVLQALLPNLAVPASLLQGEWLKEEVGFLGVIWRNGWFKTQNLPLERYLEPFIFPSGSTRLSGRGDLEGTFDHQSLVIHYDAKNVILENKDLAIDVKSISASEGDCSTTKLPAVHYFDLKQGIAFGSIPLNNGSYFEKNSGLLFTDINALIHLEKGKIYASELETFSNGVYLAGAIDTVWNPDDPGAYSVDINLHTMNGKVSQLQHLITHFNKPSFFLKFPLEGNVSLKKEGGCIHFDFNPQSLHMKSKMHGVISDGVLTSQSADVSLQELNMNFDYDYEANTFAFTDIQGTLLVGKPNRVEEYNFAGDHIRFTDYMHNEGEFDVWVGDKKRDIIRLAGKTQAFANDEGSNLVEFTLNPTLSHFGDVHPANFQLALKDWCQVHLFHLDLDFQLSSLLQDLQRFSRTGLLFLSRHFLKELNDLKTAEGDFKLSLNYDNKLSLLTYNGTGKDISFGQYQFDTFHLIGKKKDASWIIDQFQLDHISLAADFLKEENNWKINFLGARLGKSLLLGFEGKYFTNTNILEGDVNLLEVNLELMKEWPRLADFVRDYRTSGIVRGAGKARFELTKGNPGFRVEANVVAALRSCEYKGLRLKDAENAQIHFISDKGITFRNVKTALKSIKDDAVKSTINLDKCEYNFVNRECRLEGLHFETPSENLSWLAENLQQSFPDAVTQPVADIIKESKSSGALMGTLMVETSSPHCAIHLSLKEGKYRFLNKEHDLQHFALDYDPFGLKVHSQYCYQNYLFWLTVKSSAPHLDVGELCLSDSSPKESRAKQKPLTMQWQIDPTYGFIVHKAEGSFAGIHFDLKRDAETPLSKDFLSFKGSMAFNLAQAQALLHHDLAKSILDWEIGKGYLLKGNWQFGKNSHMELLDQLTFHGELEGDNFEMMGYQFSKLKGEVHCLPRHISINNMAITDSCGNLEIGEIQLQKQESGWHFQIPDLSVSEFRPSLLHLAKVSQPLLGKALIVRQINVQGLKGVMGCKETFTGRGHLYFANAAKKNLHNILFAIPGEILSRIGLDLRVLNPVMGTIFYEIRNAKVYLTRFKDIYSEGRLSKFYLPNTSYESYMDFNGNLHLQVRMKQYNLLFKLAELFTVTIQGTLKKPTYSLQKQNQQAPNPKEIVLEKK